MKFEVKYDRTKVAEMQMKTNIAKALYKMGLLAVEMIVDQMQYGYGRAIWKTGDLQRDVHFEQDNPKKIIKVGNSLKYGIAVHEGTSRMRGRAYIKDALNPTNISAMKSEVAEILKEGFK